MQVALTFHFIVFCLLFNCHILYSTLTMSISLFAFLCYVLGSQLAFLATHILLFCYLLGRRDELQIVYIFQC